jgi:hypothetical protein
MIKKPKAKKLQSKKKTPAQIDKFDDDDELIFDDEEIDDDGIGQNSHNPSKELKGRGTRVKWPTPKDPYNGLDPYIGYDEKPFQVKAAAAFEIKRFNKLYRDKGNSIVALILANMMAKLLTEKQLNKYIPKIASAIFGEDKAADKLRAIADNMSK